jgi:hypothetical protein
MWKHLDTYEVFLKDLVKLPFFFQCIILNERDLDCLSETNGIQIQIRV